MADTIQLNIRLNGAEAALATLTQLDAATKGLRQPLTIKVTGTAAATRNMEKLATSAERAQKAVSGMNAGGSSGSGAAAGFANISREAEKASKSVSKLGSAFGTIGRMAGWQIAGNVIAAGIRSVTDAFATMKDVDKELAVVQKVTGRTREEMEKLASTAYDTASKYGVAASEFLESVGTFARAGYDDAADALGELAIKTQLVGDVSAETASQFLLSVDAAYKYGGSMEALSAVLDKANAVENNYATSIQKLAEGMPIVANVAATANMSIEETIAMLGTITAVTQESGTKAATAARALILNIMKDTTTEIEDGVTLTTDQINSLSDVLWKYSADAMRAAEASGKIVDPMEAIAGLAKAAQEGLLTEQELATIASSIGGKLRTNQLLALINNFGMFNEMLETMGASAGSADAEVGIMLDTWDAKANQVKNSWTELWATIADTDAIKGALDGVNNIIGSITDLFNGQDKVETLAIRYHNQGMSVEAAAMRAYAEVNKLTDEVTGLPDFKEVTIETPGVQEAIERLNQVDALSADKTKTVTVKTTGNYGSLWPGHASGTKNAPGGPTLVNELGPELISANGLAYIAGGGKPTITNLPRGAIVLTAAETRRAMSGLGGMSGGIPAAAGGITTDPDAAISAAITALLGVFDQDNAGTGSRHYDGNGHSGRGGSFALSDAEKEAKARAEYESAAEAARADKRQAEGMAAWAAQMDATEAWLYGDGTGGGSKKRKGSATKSVKELQKELDAWLKNLKLQAELADNQGDHQKEGDLYGKAENKIQDMIDAYRAAGYADTSDEILTLENLIYDYADKQEKAYKHTWDEMEDALDDALKNIDAQIDKAESENDVVKQMELYGEAQDKIAELLNAYLEAGYSATSDEVLRLTNLGYDYANKQTGKTEDLFNDLIDALEALKNSTDEANDLAEKQAAVDSAREAYANAQRQRTVRIFNPVTGQWEWVANAADVQAAQKQLQSAEKTLSDTQFQQAINAAKNSGSLDGLLASDPVNALFASGTDADKQAILAALNAYTGASVFTPTMAPNVMGSNTDSHDTNYYFGNVEIPKEMAETMTLAQLAEQLGVLGIA